MTGPAPGRAFRSHGAALAALTAALVSAAPPRPAAAHPVPRAHLHTFVEGGVRALDGRGLLVLRPGLTLEAPDLRLVVAPPLELDPRSGSLRAEAWDERSDLGALLTRLELGAPHGAFRLQAGDLSQVRLGHGTLVAGYVTTVDPDHPHAGAHATVAGRAARLELLAGDVLAAGLLAARASVAPLALAGGAAAWRVGLTAAGDPAAPVALTGELGPGRLPDGGTRPVLHLGLDTDWVLWRGEGLALAPYVDGVLAAAGPLRGRGALHLGLLADLSLGGEATLSVRAEARRLGRGWTPEPFGAFYALERWAGALGTGAPVALGTGAPGGWGGRLGLELGLGGLALGLEADGRAHGPANAALRLHVPGPGPLTGALHVAHRGFAGWSGALDGRGWLWLGEARWELGRGAWAGLRAGRVLRVDAAAARFRPAWDLALAVGAGW